MAGWRFHTLCEEEIAELPPKNLARLNCKNTKNILTMTTAIGKMSARINISEEQENASFI